MPATSTLWASGTPTTTGTTWATTTNATGANNATFASWTNTTSGGTGNIVVSGYGAQTAIGAAPTSVDSLDVTVYGYVTNTGRMASMTVQLTDSGTNIGSAQNMTLTTTTTNSQTFTFTGVTWANLANIGVRVSFTRGAVTQAANGMLDAVGLVVNYTAPVNVTYSPTGITSAEAFGTAVGPAGPGVNAPWVGTPVDGNVAGTASTSVTVDVSGATNGEVVWIIGTVGDAQTAAITPPTGWTMLGQSSEGTSGGSSSRTYIMYKTKTSGDTNVTVNWTVSANKQAVAISWPGVDTTNPASTPVWVTHTTGTAYATGSDTPADANRWAVGVFSSRGSTTVTAWTPDAALTERVDAINTGSPFIGLEVADSGANVTAAAHSYTATGQTASHGLGGLFYLKAGVNAPTNTTVTPDGITSQENLGGGQTGTWSAASNISDVSGNPVEPEAHTWNPALSAPNGSLYRVMESSLADGNHPQMMRSTDGGATWAQVGTNPSSVTDLEAVTISLSGTTINVTVNRDDTVWWVPFNTTTNTWGTVETVASGLATTGVAQGCFQVELSDGTHWIFYSASPNGANQQIVYRKRTGTNTYGTVSATTAFSATTNNVASPKAVRGANDLTYVFYTDSTAGHVYMRTLSSTGTLSAASQVDDSGAFNPTPYLANDVISAPTYYNDGGVEVISVLWCNTAGYVFLTQYRNGVKQTSQQINSSAVVINPAATTSDAAVISLACDMNTMSCHIVYAEAVTGDLYYRRRDYSGTLTTPTKIFDSPTTDGSYYAFAAFFTYSGTQYIGVAYDAGAHGNDVSYVQFTKATFQGGGPTITQSAPSANSQPTGIASAEAFGTATATKTLTSSPTGIATAEAFGTAVESATLTSSPTGVATGEAFGALTRTSTLTSSPTGIPSLETFGTAVISGVISASPTGIATAEAFGTATRSATLTSSPTGLATAEAFGTATITGALTVSPSGAVTAEAFGTAVANVGGAPATPSPTGIASAESFGAVTATWTITASPTGVVSAEAFGTTVANKTLTSAPTGIVTAEAEGNPTITQVGPNVTASPTGIATAEALGTPSSLAASTRAPVGISSLEAFGTPTATPTLIATATGIASGEAFGTTTATKTLTSAPTGIVTAEAFGTATRSSTLTSSPTGIATGEGFGTPVRNLTGQYNPTGITSAEAFGTPTMGGTLAAAATGIASAQALGVPTATKVLAVTAIGIASFESFGTASAKVNARLTPVGIASAQAFGTPSTSIVVFQFVYHGGQWIPIVGFFRYNGTTWAPVQSIQKYTPSGWVG